MKASVSPTGFIPARRSWWAAWVFRYYLRQIMKKSFSEIRYFGEIPRLPADMPILLAPNHSTWWDGFFIFIINYTFWKRPIYIMMLEEQLRRYWFFAKLGAFSIDQTKRSAIQASLQYVVSLFSSQSHPAPVVVIFPQGKLLPNDIRPLGVRGGVERILKQTPRQVALVPIAFRCEFLQERLPTIFFQFGEPIVTLNGENIPTKVEIEQCLSVNLDKLKQAIIRGEDSTQVNF